MKKNKILSYVIPFVSIFLVSGAQAAKIKPAHKIHLDTCSVNITADTIHTHQNKTTYSGNVTVLVGFASLKSSKVTVIRNPNGSCDVISE